MLHYAYDLPDSTWLQTMSHQPDVHHLVLRSIAFSKAAQQWLKWRVHVRMRATRYHNYTALDAPIITDLQLHNKQECMIPGSSHRRPSQKRDGRDGTLLPRPNRDEDVPFESDQLQCPTCITLPLQRDTTRRCRDQLPYLLHQLPEFRA